MDCTDPARHILLICSGNNPHLYWSLYASGIKFVLKKWATENPKNSLICIMDHLFSPRVAGRRCRCPETTRLEQTKLTTKAAVWQKTRLV